MSNSTKCILRGGWRCHALCQCSDVVNGSCLKENGFTGHGERGGARLIKVPLTQITEPGAQGTGRKSARADKFRGRDPAKHSERRGNSRVLGADTYRGRGPKLHISDGI